jgi:Thiamine pyrophosphate enzyme, N-terminal TPP binding domain
MTEHRNGDAAVMETLAAHGVDTIFGIPGTHNLEIYRQFPAGRHPCGHAASRAGRRLCRRQEVPAVSAEVS